MRRRCGSEGWKSFLKSYSFWIEGKSILSKICKLDISLTETPDVDNLKFFIEVWQGNNNCSFCNRDRFIDWSKALNLTCNPGVVRLKIVIFSWHSKTLREIRRKMQYEGYYRLVEMFIHIWSDFGFILEQIMKASTMYKDTLLRKRNCM